MKRLSIVAVAVAAVVLIGIMLNLRHVMAQQQPACLHGQNEAPDQLARRRAALGLTRLINGLQAAFKPTAPYQPLAQLAVGAIPAGFAVQLTTDGTSYAFSVKDTLDACRFGFFSDQDGMIFAGEVIR